MSIWRSILNPRFMLILFYGTLGAFFGTVGLWFTILIVDIFTNFDILSNDISLWIIASGGGAGCAIAIFGYVKTQALEHQID